MKILELTPHRIILRDRAISLWLSAACLTLGGLVAIAQGKLIILTCHRGLSPQNHCQLSKFGTLGIGSSQQLLNNLQGASIDTHYSSKGGATYAVVLSTGLGNVQLTNHYSSGHQEKEAIAAQVNAFVDNPKQLSLQVKQDDRLSMLLFGGLLLGAGAVFVVALCRVTHCDLDRTTGKLRLARWGIRGTHVSEYLLHQVISAELDTRVKKYKGKLHTSYRISFRLLEVGLVHLNRFYAEDQQRPKVASALSQFLATRPVSIRESEAIVSQDASLCEAEVLYRLGMKQYRQRQMQEAGINLKQARELFSAQHNAQRAMEIQTMLWQLGLD
jgi:hypothetical protein